MLNYKGIYYTYGNPSDLTNSLEEINKIEALIKNKEVSIKELEYELNILKDERIRVYKKHVKYDINCFMSNAYKWFNAVKSGTLNGEKIDKRKNYNEKDSYKYFMNWMNNHIGYDCEITGICDFNFGQGWNIYFNAAGHKWILELPVVEKINNKSMDYYGGDVYKIHLSNYDRDHSSKRVGETFEEDELKEIFAEGLKKYERPF